MVNVNNLYHKVESTGLPVKMYNVQIDFVVQSKQEAKKIVSANFSQTFNQILDITKSFFFFDTAKITFKTIIIQHKNFFTRGSWFCWIKHVTSDKCSLFVEWMVYQTDSNNHFVKILSILIEYIKWIKIWIIDSYFSFRLYYTWVFEEYRKNECL